ncbi:hypothetical protein D3C81_578550 [compost metagenome]
MPNTGHFYVLAIDLATDARGHVEAVRSITVRCHRCTEITQMDPTSLGRTPDMVELICAACGTYQSVSIARFECEHLLPCGR